MKFTAGSLYIVVGLLLLGACATPPSQPEMTVVPSAEPSGGDASKAAWRQWGGPGGDFKVDVAGLASTWPPEGPPVVWTRSLGPGYSAIAVDDGVLYTMYRDDEEDVVIAATAAEGRTLWEHRYAAPTHAQNQTEFGKGPHATPLVLDDRVVTLGYTGILNCLDRKTGDVLWTRELIRDFGGDAMSFGYTASPIEYEGTVVVLAGGPRQGALALSPADGSVVWSGKPTRVSYATPIVIDVDGQDQLVYFSEDEIIGLQASNGAFLWSFPVVNQYRNNCTSPHWGDDNLLWVATQLDGGTRALRLKREGERTRVEEVWSSSKMSIHYWNTLRLGGHVYASIGGNASILAAIDLATGNIEWRERGFTKVNFVHAGDRTLLLDAEGHLALVRLSPAGMQILAQARIKKGPTWTVPTLVGTRLYVRDKQSLMAFDLGRTAVEASAGG